MLNNPFPFLCKLKHISVYFIQNRMKMTCISQNVEGVLMWNLQQIIFLWRRRYSVYWQIFQMCVSVTYRILSRRPVLPDYTSVSRDYDYCTICWNIAVRVGICWNIIISWPIGLASNRVVLILTNQIKYCTICYHRPVIAVFNPVQTLHSLLQTDKTSQPLQRRGQGSQCCCHNRLLRYKLQRIWMQ